MLVATDMDKQSWFKWCGLVYVLTRMKSDGIAED